LRRSSATPRIGDAVGLNPGDDDLVTDVLVDFAAAELDRFGDCRKHRGQEAMCLQRPEPLGNRGRAHHVDEEEEASLGVRPAIPSKQESRERAVADEARGLKHHHHDGNGHEREENRNQPGSRVIDGDDAQQALSRLAGKDRPSDRAVDKRLQDEHRGERQRVEPSHRIESALRRKAEHRRQGRTDNRRRRPHRSLQP
jgi:hypothetical protein